MTAVKTVKLGDMVMIKTGKLDANASSANGAYPFFTCSRNPLKINTYSYDCKCVLVAGNGDLNVKYYEGKFDAYQRTYIIESLDDRKLDTRYLYYFLLKYVDKLRELSIGGVIKYIKLNNLTDPQIPLPPLEDQKHVVRELDAADALRQKRKQAIALLDDYLKAVFLEMFGDPVENPMEWDRLYGDDYSELLTVGVVIRPAFHYVENGVIALRSLNIKKNAIDLSNIVYFSKESHCGILSKSTLHLNDVVIVRTGSTGTAAVVPKELDGMNCIDLIIVRPIKKILNPFYFSFLLNSERGVSLVASKEVGGIQKHFNIGALKKLPIPIPPIELQNKFADIVHKVEKIRGTMNLQSGYIENSFNALMQEVFNEAS